VVLRNLAIRDCIAEGLTTYDFLGGLEEFKTRWGTETHYVTDVYLGAPGLSGGAAFAAVAGGRHARVWLRDHMPESVVRGHKRLKSRVRTLLTRSTQQTTTEADQ